MKQVKVMLKERADYLSQLKKVKEKALAAAPEGTLRICRRGNRTLYYHRTDPKDFNGSYLSTKETLLPSRLAQKDYDERILRSAEQELRAIQKYTALCPKISVEEIYEILPDMRRKLILPIVEPVEQFIADWEAVEYSEKAISGLIPEYYTAKGERVRSKSEIIIADSLSREAIPYHYEKPLYLEGIGTVHPDFTVLNPRLRKEFYWEHLGMMDDASYAEHAIQKIAAYEQNGFFPGETLILTYETRQNPISQKVISLMIQKYLK